MDHRSDLTAEEMDRKARQLVEKASGLLDQLHQTFGDISALLVDANEENRG